MIQAKIPYKACIEWDQQKLKVKGSLTLLKKIHLLKSQFGLDPSKWPLQKNANNEDILLNEFIQKCRGDFKLVYEHEELCHCRMISTDKVFNAIKQGLRTQAEVSKATLAGTGCGSCRPDIESLIKQWTSS